MRIVGQGIGNNVHPWHVNAMRKGRVDGTQGWMTFERVAPCGRGISRGYFLDWESGF